MTNEITRRWVLKGLALTAGALAVPKVSESASYQPSLEESLARLSRDAEIVSPETKNYGRGKIKALLNVIFRPGKKFFEVLRIYPENSNILISYNPYGGVSFHERKEQDEIHERWPKDFPSFEKYVERSFRGAEKIEIDSKVISKLLENYHSAKSKIQKARELEKEASEIYRENDKTVKDAFGHIRGFW